MKKEKNKEDEDAESDDKNTAVVRTLDTKKTFTNVQILQSDNSNFGQK
jgi:hypothetical protein